MEVPQKSRPIGNSSVTRSLSESLLRAGHDAISKSHHTQPWLNFFSHTYYARNFNSIEALTTREKPTRELLERMRMKAHINKSVLGYRSPLIVFTPGMLKSARISSGFRKCLVQARIFCWVAALFLLFFSRLERILKGKILMALRRLKGSLAEIVLISDACARVVSVWINELLEPGTAVLIQRSSRAFKWIDQRSIKE